MTLTVIICGAGIAGLSAAIALAREGHTVHLFEKSRFSNEIGAALHFAPHVVRVLTRWGLDIDSFRSCICSTWHTVTSDHQELELRFDLESKKKELGVAEDEIMLHRVDAHSVLRDKALSYPNVTLHLASPISTVQPESGIIELEDGSRFQGDVVVGADGVHSKTVEALNKTEYKPYTFSVNMYRFMVDTDRALASPSLNKFLQDSKYLTTHNSFVGSTSRGLSMLVMYPCRDGSLLNMATFQDSRLEKVSLGTSFTNPGAVEDVLNLFTEWPEHFLELVSLGEDVKHWALVTGKPRPTLVKDKLVLIGDAGHPSLPTHGAGAGLAIEDAGVLGALLDSNTTVEKIPERLQLFHDLRFERVSTVKCASDMYPPGTKDVDVLRQKSLHTLLPNACIPKDMEAFLWPVDAVAQAREALRVKEQRGI